MPTWPKPTRADLVAARGKTIPDVIAPGLRVLFCGINPSLYSAAVGHHFGRPGNRFWPALFAAGFTPRLLSAFEDAELLSWGYGVTNLVPLATARADELTSDQLLRGGRSLRRKLRRFRPAAIAFLGIGSYRSAFGVDEIRIGEQATRMEECRVWVLPNPSGLNAHYQLADLAKLYGELREAAKESPSHPGAYPSATPSLAP